MRVRHTRQRHLARMSPYLRFSYLLRSLSPSLSPFLSLYCNVQNIGRCRRTSKSYESAAAGAERDGEKEIVGAREGRRIRIWMACVHTPRQGQDMAESTQLSEMCRKKIKEKNNAKSCDKFTFLRSPSSSSFRLFVFF